MNNKKVEFPLLRGYRLAKKQDQKVKKASKRAKISDAAIIRQLINKYL